MNIEEQKIIFDGDRYITKKEFIALEKVMFPELYNQAIDDAIDRVKSYGVSSWRLTEPSLMAEDLEKQLEALKKNKQ